MQKREERKEEDWLGADAGWVVYGTSYSPHPIIEFSLNFLGRDWFGAGLKGAEGLTFAQLMLTIYTVQREGLLMSKKDAMRAIGAEHVSTAKRYADLAVERGMLRVEPSDLDRRVELLVPTDAGIQIIEKELETISRTVQWAEAKRQNEDQRVRELQEDITVTPPRLEHLTLVNDPSAPSTANLVKNRGWARPKTIARHIAAYSETIRLMPKNIPALSARCQHYKSVGEFKNALADANRLEELQPGEWLKMRAYLHEELEEHDQAIADISRWMKLYPEDYPSARITRARAFAAKEQWQNALDDIIAAMGIEDRSGPPDWVRLRGVVYFHLGRIPEAINDLEYASDRLHEYIGLLCDPDYHKTFSTGEKNRRDQEEACVKDVGQLDAFIETLKRQNSLTSSS